MDVVGTQPSRKAKHMEDLKVEMVKVVSWNVNTRLTALDELVCMDADVALLQEVPVNGWRLLARVGGPVAVTPHEPWLPWQPTTYNRWPLVVQLSERVRLDWFSYRHPVHFNTREDQFEVSGVGTIAVARVTPVKGGEPFIAVSMYARWRAPHPSVGDQQWIHAEASAHRIISDLSAFTSHREGSTHRILAAGDLNMGFTGRFEHNGRSLGVLTRMSALGLEYLGPQGEDDNIAPTYRRRGQGPDEADTQMDHVFASRGFHQGATVSTMNGVNEWGPSDHCRVVIEL